MKILSFNRMYLPALSIAAGVGLLLALLGISTYRNLDRQRAAALASLSRQGTALLKALEAGARTGMMMPMWSEEAIDLLIREIGRDESIGYIYIVEPDGRVAHHGGQEKPADNAYPSTAPGNAAGIIETVRILPDGASYYEIAKRFHPYTFPPTSHQRRHMMGPYRDAAGHSHEGDILVIGLRMTAFEEARRADIQHSLMMAGVLLLLGTAVLFFIFVIQNYYLVDRTLSRTRDYTRQVLASMAHGLIGIDAAGRVTSYNAKAVELLGMDEAAFDQGDLGALIDFKKHGIEATLTRCQVHLEREMKHRRPSGETIPLALSTAPILDDSGDCLGAVILLRDLTEIKRLETRLRRAETLAAVGQLAAGVAHEIRNPLSSVRGFAQFLQRALEGRPREQDYAATMVAEVDRIDRVVSDLLSLSRPLEPEAVACVVADLARHVARLVGDEARSRGVRLELELPPDPVCFRVDPNLMTQALLNLVLNALHASPPGGAVAIGAAVEKHGALRLWVADDGHGVAPEHVERIFDPFFTTRSRGTGLGLAIVQQVVEAHDGEIAVESPPAPGGRGSRFTIKVPRGPAEA